MPKPIESTFCEKCGKPKFGPYTTICTADTLDRSFQQRYCVCMEVYSVPTVAEPIDGPSCTRCGAVVKQGKCLSYGSTPECTGGEAKESAKDFVRPLLCTKPHDFFDKCPVGEGPDAPEDTRLNVSLGKLYEVMESYAASRERQARIEAYKKAEQVAKDWNCGGLGYGCNIAAAIHALIEAEEKR